MVGSVGNLCTVFFFFPHPAFPCDRGGLGVLTKCLLGIGFTKMF